MGKALGAILTSIEGPVLGLFRSGPSGALQGLSNLATAYFGGPIASAVAIGGAVVGSLQQLPRPPITESAIKAPVVPRQSGYGLARQSLSVVLA